MPLFRKFKIIINLKITNKQYEVFTVNKKLIRFLTLFLIFFVLPVLLYGQNNTNKSALQEFAKEKTEEFNKKKAEAVEYAKQNDIPLNFVRKDGVYMELMYIDNGLPVYYKTDNVNAAATISSSKVWEEGAAGLSLSGDGITLGVWDGGKVLTTHQEFEGRAVPGDGAVTTSEHATHVAGTVGAAGINPSAKGMSYNADLRTHDWNNDDAEMASAAASGLLASNHSYGVVAGWEYDYRNDGKWAWLGDLNVSETEDWEFGFYTSATRAWDAISYNAPNYLIVRSAGNEREESGPGTGSSYWIRQSGVWSLSTEYRDPDGPYDCIQADKVGKNILTVAAVGDIPDGYHTSTDVLMSSFSSWGPADDGRVKPDISANGVGLYSTSDLGNTSYATMSGTSMSSPSVTGSIGLIQEHWSNLISSQTPPLSSTVKGLIIHTADEAGESDGPDYAFGWGLMNTYKAINLISYDAATGKNNFIRELTINQGQTITIEVESNGNSPLWSTICWIDYPGTPPATGLNPRTPVLVNDLDLRIKSPSGAVYEPWKLDPTNPSAAATRGDNIVDNVEKVEVGETEAGTYVIEITHKGNLQNGFQKVSVLISGIALDAPQATAAVYPAQGAVEVPLEPTFIWNRVETAEAYQIEIATDSGFNNVLYSQDGIDVVNYISEELPDQTQLYWRVRAYNNGGYSNWSSATSFTTQIAIPASPVLVYPEDEFTEVSTSPELIWNSVTRADSYHLQLSSSSLLITNLVDEENLTDTTYHVEGLEDGTRYYWRVYANNESGTSLADKYIFYTELYTPDSLTLVSDSSGNVNFTWVDRSENETQYVVERKTVVDEDFVAIDTLGKNIEQYTDTQEMGSGLVQYRLYLYNTRVTSKYSDTLNVDVLSGVEDMAGVPQNFAMHQNYPNPFNPSTSIAFDLPQASVVKLEVFNILGERAAMLIDAKEFSAGYHKVDFNAAGLTSGVYIYRMQANAEGGKSFISTNKMVILK